MPPAEAVAEGEPAKYRRQVPEHGNVRLYTVSVESYGPRFTMADG